MPEIVAVGECLIELYSDEPIGEASRFHRAYAGDTCNAALMAARLGSSCGYVTRMGDDPFADYLLAEFHKVGLDTSRVKRVDGFNGVHFISLLPDGDREFVYYRNGSAASTMTPDDLDSGYIGSASILHVSAILQATSQSARETVLEAAKMARRLGVTVSYDTNLRLTLWSAEEARATVEDTLPYVDVVFVSHPSETEAMLGVDSELAAIEFLLDRGVNVAAVKCGADGSWVATPDRRRPDRRHRARRRLGHDRRRRRIRGRRAARYRPGMGAVRGRALGRRERGPQGRRQGSRGQPAVARTGRGGRRLGRPDVAVTREQIARVVDTLGLTCLQPANRSQRFVDTVGLTWMQPASAVAVQTSVAHAIRSPRVAALLQRRVSRGAHDHQRRPSIQPAQSGGPLRANGKRGEATQV